MKCKKLGVVAIPLAGQLISAGDPKDMTGVLRSLVAVLAILLWNAGCGQDESYTVDGLAKMLQHTDPAMRYTATEQLGLYGAEATPAVPQLSLALKDSDPNVRLGAAYALANIGVEAASALPALTEAMQDQDVEFRLAAVYAIAAVGLNSPTAMTALQQALQDSDERVRLEASQSIRKWEAAARYRQSVPATGDQTNAKGPP